MRLRFRPFARSAGVVGQPPPDARRWPQPFRRRPPAVSRPDVVPPALDPPVFDAPRFGPPRFGPPPLGLSRFGLPRRDPPDLDPPVPDPDAAWRHHADLATERVDMWQDPPRRWPVAGAAVTDDERLRPLYARALGLRHVEPGVVLCFVFFEGTVVLGFLLALAELVSWWGVLMLPASVALMVKVNDAVAAAVARSAARVPEVEQERFRRELQPAVGRAAVPGSSPASAAAAHRPVRSGSPAPRGASTGHGSAAGHGIAAGHGVPAGHGASAVGWVRPELAPARARPRPARRGGHPADDGREHGESAPTPAGPLGQRDEPPPVRRARNDLPAERGRRAPTYPPDRWDSLGSPEQRKRQSAHRHYRPDERH